MKPIQLLLAILLAFPFYKNLAASFISADFLTEISGRWYITQTQGGITGETVYYDPIPRDSVIISQITGTDSISITGYHNEAVIAYDKFRVIWSNNINYWTLSINDHEIITELSGDEFTIYMTENIITYKRINFTGMNLYEGNIDSAMTIMQGRWYLTAIGSGDFEIEENPGSGDSVIVTVISETDSLQLNYYKNCLLDYSDTFRIVIDSSYSLQTDALMLVGSSETDRYLVTVSESSMTLKTDSIPGHYLVVEHIDTFFFYKPPMVLSVTVDTACKSDDLALMAEADPGLIRWFTTEEGGSPVSHGTVFFPANISETTTFYVDAFLNGCESAPRIPVTAVLNPSPEFTSITGSARCGEGQVVLTASSNEGIIYWYADSIAAMELATGNTFETPVLDTTTVYFIAVLTNTCSSERMPVTATISYADSCLTTNGPNLSVEKIITFPDPTTGKFQVWFEDNDHQRNLKICNASGLLLKEFRPEKEEHSVSIDISEFPDGLYLIILQDDSNVFVKKIIKE